MTTTPAACQLDSLSLSYGQIDCIKNVSLTLKQGTFYGLIGPNGSGKSSLLDLISGHTLPQSGSIRIYGKKRSDYPRKEFARLLTSVPQSFTLNFDYSVEDVVLMGRYPYLSRFAKPQTADQYMAETAIDLMGITHLKHRKVTHLSGGEKQRVMIARALAQDTSIILLDEVTANLDINHAITIMKTMDDLVHDRKRLVIAALHDLNMALSFCDHLIVMQNGAVKTTGPTEEILTEDLIMDLYSVSSTIYSQEPRNMHIRYEYRR